MRRLLGRLTVASCGTASLSAMLLDRERNRRVEQLLNAGVVVLVGLPAAYELWRWAS
jgi:hypothetical protein